MSTVRATEIYLTKSSYGDENLEGSPQLICICWTEDGVVVRMAEYTLNDIDAELGRSELNAEMFGVLREARSKLLVASGLTTE